MANNGLFIKLENDKTIAYNDIKEKDILLNSKYIIPLFWISLFDKTCIKEEVFEEGEEKYIYPILISSVKDSLVRFEKNKEKLFNKMPNKIKKYYNEFNDFLKGFDSKYIQIDFLELFVMGNDEMKEEIIKYFKYFEEEDIKIFDDILIQCGFLKSKLFNKIKYDKKTFKEYLRGSKFDMNLKLE